jgi:hypothetical protein
MIIICNYYLHTDTVTIWTNDFSSILCIQIGSGAHSVSCTMSTESFPRGKTA